MKKLLAFGAAALLAACAYIGPSAEVKSPPMPVTRMPTTTPTPTFVRRPVREAPLPPTFPPTSTAPPTPTVPPTATPNTTPTPSMLPTPTMPPALASILTQKVTVYFATDRLPTRAGSKPVEYFSSGWNKSGDHLITGNVVVGIPPHHKEGKVERPTDWIIYQRSEDSTKDFVLLKPPEVLSSDLFYKQLRDEFASRSLEQRSALVFIHGFNVTFNEAAYNTAQLAYDLHFQGLPMMFSWPSQGHLRSYDGDEDTVDFSAPHLQSFLERVSRESGALRINLIAHSMENRVMTAALKEIGRQPDIKPLFQNVVMAAPDVNAYVFTDQLWPAIKNVAKQFTLYASSDDNALRASKLAKGKSDFQRLGEAGPNIVVIPGMDTIDASGVDTSMLGHSYISECIPVIDDLNLLIEQGLAPIKRNLHDRQKLGLAYWEFQGGRAMVMRAARKINKTIAAKAVSVDQLNHFCAEADLFRPAPLTVGTEQERLETAKAAVMKQVRNIIDAQEIQKAAAAAKMIFGP